MVQFHAIRTLEGLSRSGAAAALVSAEDLGWGAGSQVDPAILDGGLQLALLWTEHVLEGASLPTAVAGLSVYGDGLGRARIHGVLYRDTVDKERAVSDVLFVTDDGAVVAKLRGVETHLLPVKPAAAAVLAGDA